MELPKANRERFGHGDAGPDGEADGRPIKAAQLRVRSLNFGQQWRTPGVRDLRYSVTLPLAFVAHMLRRELLPAYVEDCIAFPGADALEDALRRRQWPESGQVLDDPELCSLALSWIAHGCLLEWLGDGEPDMTPGFVINTIDQSDSEREFARFAGTARATGQPVQYQDA